MPALTKRAVDAAKPHAERYFVWCSDLAGFGVRVYPSGKKVFVAQVRVGRFQRRVTIGAYGPYTVEKARKRAEDISSGGADPIYSAHAAVRGCALLGRIAVWNVTIDQGQ